MSNDTAAFFANKKKKKGFKFNANLVDADSIAPRDHVDAPAIEGKTAADGAPASGPIDPNTTATDSNKPQQEEWDDAALASDFTRKASTNAAETVRDMKSLEAGKNHSGNIAEKLRVEETKAQLAAAREGMEREAKLLKEKKEADEAKKQQAAARTSTATGTASGGIASRWTSPSLSRVKMGANTIAPSGNRRFNVEDEELFPDLAAAGKILEQKEKDQQAAYKPIKKTPVGGGASWASKPKSLSTSATVAPEPEPTLKPTAEAAPVQEEAKEEPAVASVPVVSQAPATTTEASSAPKVAPKKKKKDLSTFKPKA